MENLKAALCISEQYTKVHSKISNDPNTSMSIVAAGNVYESLKKLTEKHYGPEAARQLESQAGSRTNYNPLSSLLFPVIKADSAQFHMIIDKKNLPDFPTIFTTVLFLSHQMGLYYDGLREFRQGTFMPDEEVDLQAQGKLVETLRHIVKNYGSSPLRDDKLMLARLNGRDGIIAQELETLGQKQADFN